MGSLSGLPPLSRLSGEVTPPAVFFMFSLSRESRVVIRHATVGSKQIWGSDALHIH